MRVLLIGSGCDALAAENWDLSKWTVCAINAAWAIAPDHLDYHIKSGDWIPPEGYRPPPDLYQKVKPISYKEYDSEYLHQLYGKQNVGIGSTMFFNAAYWILGHLPDTRLLGFVGCSMYYPNGNANTFYKSGNADPLRFGNNYLIDRFNILNKTAEDRKIRLFNFGCRGLMPYPLGNFHPRHSIL